MDDLNSLSLLPGSPLSSCATLGKLFKLSGPKFPHNIYLEVLLLGLNEITSMKVPGLNPLFKSKATVSEPRD